MIPAACASAGLALEAPERVRVRERAAAEELDGDALAQRLVRGGDDDAHAAFPEHVLDAVFPGEHGARDHRRRSVLQVEHLVAGEHNASPRG